MHLNQASKIFSKHSLNNSIINNKSSQKQHKINIQSNNENADNGDYENDNRLSSNTTKK